MDKPLQHANDRCRSDASTAKNAMRLCAFAPIDDSKLQ